MTPSWSAIGVPSTRSMFVALAVFASVLVLVSFFARVETESRSYSTVLVDVTDEVATHGNGSRPAGVIVTVKFDGGTVQTSRTAHEIEVLLPGCPTGPFLVEVSIPTIGGGGLITELELTAAFDETCPTVSAALDRHGVLHQSK